MKNTSEQKKLVDLGFENGWSVLPEIVKQCHHKRKIYRNASIKETECLECGFTFKTDSSD